MTLIPNTPTHDNAPELEAAIPGGVWPCGVYYTHTPINFRHCGGNVRGGGHVQKDAVPGAEWVKAPEATLKLDMTQFDDPYGVLTGGAP